MPVTFNVLANDKDLDGGVLSILEFTQPADGVVALNPDGTFSYTRLTKGRRSFTYTISDGQGGWVTGKVIVK